MSDADKSDQDDGLNSDGNSPHDDGGLNDTDRKVGRRKITIEYINDKSKRHITFSKRKSGIMKKAFELSTLTGTQVLLVVASETGHVYTFATKKLKPLITRPEGKNLIQACLSVPDSPPASPQDDSQLPTTSSGYSMRMQQHQQQGWGDEGMIAQGVDKDDDGYGSVYGMPQHRPPPMQQMLPQSHYPSSSMPPSMYAGYPGYGWQQGKNMMSGNDN